jgi:hypothetical protein
MDNLLAAKNQEAEDILYDALDNQDWSDASKTQEK